MAQPRRFRVNAKNYFLTYPQCPITIQEAIAQIIATSTPTNKKYLRVCRELHEDGQPRLHALLQFEGKFNCQNPRFFDIRHPNRSASYRCNVQAAKSNSDVKSYIEKGGEFAKWGEFQIDLRSARGGQQSVSEDGHNSEDPKQSTADMTVFVQDLLQQMQARFQTMSESIVTKIDEMGSRINELEQSIDDLRAEIGAEGSPSPLAPSKKPEEVKLVEGSA